MPKGLVRHQDTTNLHFITFSCYQRKPYLASPQSRILFEQSLETMRRRYDFFIVGYVVMPEHVHLLISEPEKGQLAIALQALKLSVAVKSIQRPFWQKRYYDFNVFTERKRIEKLRYMHRNPIVRGLVEEPDQWAWSSFRHWWTGKEGIVEIESNWTARRREEAGINIFKARILQTHVSEARRGAPSLFTNEEV